MLTIIIFLLILSLLVIVHEWGHFYTARKCGMKVYEFGLGFPPRIGGIYKDPKTGKWKSVSGSGKGSLKETVGGDERIEEYPSTLYSFNWLPLGGFVKIKGESGEAATDKDSFAHHKPWKRLVVLVAGVTMNIVLAAVLLAVGFMIGLPSDVTEGIPEGATVVREQRVVVQQVLKDSPADVAGLEFGDAIVSIADQEVRKSTDVPNIISQIGAQEVTVEFMRAEETKTTQLTPGVIEKAEDDTPRAGVLLVDTAVVRYPWYVSLWKGVVAAVLGLINIFIAFFILIKNLILGKGLAFEVSGPVGIASIVGQSARLGINYLINVTAMISLSLAAINILPIPALDGGRALFVIIEKITGRPVPMRYEQTAHTIGFILLMLLIVVVTWRDIVGLVT